MTISRVVCIAMAVSAAVCGQEREGGSRPGFGQGGFMRMSPILAAVDADHDGTISAAELKAAPAALKALDKNGDGQLTQEELRPAFARGGPGGTEGRGGPGETQAPSADELVKTLMAFDKDGDGKLSKAELPERMQGLFERADADKDGYLTAEELKKTAAAPRAEQAGRRGERAVGEGGRRMQRMDPASSALDADQDGTISAQEMKGATGALAKLDRNGDGQLTEDEVRPNFGGRGGQRPPREQQQ
ncbi:EF-hand domain-containing protein [Paludibaculum fermentans]|uniref:EF-hand domain-containing protein n=1 Tax=Paludibaculum fermentans TaxID=1473598 RepID=UPI003EBB6F33